MKKKNLIFSLIALFAIGSFSCSDDEIDFNLNQNQNVFETVDVNLDLVLEEVTNDNSKSASVSSLDSLEITMLYENGGQWVKVAKTNFSDTVDLTDFCNPVTVEFYPPLRIDYVLKANCRFVFRGLDLAGNNTYYGVVEADLRDVVEETNLVVPMVETKSYWGLNVIELTASSYRYIFDYSAAVREIDYEGCLKTIPPIDGSQVPSYYYNDPETVTGQLIVEGENVTLNGSPVDSTNYIDVLEYWGASASEVNLTITAYDDTTELWSNSVSKNWLEFGFNHYVRVDNVTSVSTTFDLLDNEDVVEDWDVQEEESMPSIFEGMIGYWNLQNDALDSHEDNDGTEYYVDFNGESMGFENHEYANMSLNYNISEQIGSNDFTISIFIEKNATGCIFDKALYSLFGPTNTESYSRLLCRAYGTSVTAHIQMLKEGEAPITLPPTHNLSILIPENNNEMYLFTLSREGNLWKVGINGQNYQSLELEGNVNTKNMSELKFGIGKLYGNYKFDKRIKFCSIHNRALNPEEILYLYNEGQGRSYSEL